MTTAERTLLLVIAKIMVLRAWEREEPVSEDWIELINTIEQEAEDPLDKVLWKNELS